MTFQVTYSILDAIKHKIRIKVTVVEAWNECAINQALPAEAIGIVRIDRKN